MLYGELIRMETRQVRSLEPKSQLTNSTPMASATVFGMDFDPITGRLWDTENGPEFGDEVNVVEPGFNSGWKAITGFPEQ